MSWKTKVSSDPIPRIMRMAKIWSMEKYWIPKTSLYITKEIGMLIHMFMTARELRNADLRWNVR